MKFLMMLFLIIPSLSFGHGETKPGPHGGHIRMPGAFHTELVLNKDQSIQVYLLDINFKNPSVKDSNVEVIAKSAKGTSIPFNCAPMEESHFHCLPEKRFSLNGELIVKAVREKAAGNESVYKLPLPHLKDKTKKSEEEEHHHH
ncbi:MAG: hypothetical protein ACXVCY_16275 [Pseudobdellovibrionaceae bacterium]